VQKLKAMVLAISAKTEAAQAETRAALAKTEAVLAEKAKLATQHALAAGRCSIRGAGVLRRVIVPGELRVSNPSPGGCSHRGR
jgi:hypothetical protein